MLPAGAQTPREKILRPFFSTTVGLAPAAFTRRVRPASPGGKSAQAAGTSRMRPSAVLTRRGSLVGATVSAFMARLHITGRGRNVIGARSRNEARGAAPANHG